MNTVLSAFDLTPDVLVPVIGSLIADELILMRRDSGLKKQTDLLKSFQWRSTTVITLHHRSAAAEQEIAIDSLEWMAIASRVVTFFQMQHSGIEDYLLRVHTLGEWAEVVVKSRQLGGLDLCFSTSGSTGTAKNIPHSWKSLCSEIEFIKIYLNTVSGQTKRVISLVPAQHIYGFLFTVLLPSALAVPVIRGLASYSTVFTSALQPGDLIIAFPSVIQQLEKRLGSVPQGVSLVCSTGPCAAEVLQQLKARGIEAIIEVYGSSETAGIGVRTNPLAPYQLMPRWKKHSTQALQDQVNDLVVHLPDQLDWQDDFYFRPVGRIDQAVSVNGINVFPVKIARQLAFLPGVTEARVRLLSDFNSRGLKALLVVEHELSAADKTLLINQVQQWALKHLVVEEIPLSYTVMTSVPVNDMGKEMDWNEKEGLS